MYGKNAKSHINLRVKPHSTFAFTAHFLPVLDFISAIYGLKQKTIKWPIFDQNHGVPPLEISQFLDILHFLFLKPRKAFSYSRIS